MVSFDISCCEFGQLRLPVVRLRQGIVASKCANMLKLFVRFYEMLDIQKEKL